MRSRLILVAVTMVSVAVVAGCSSADSGAVGGTTAPHTFEAKSMTVGAVEVTVQPTKLDDTGAAFSVTLDTHSGSLDADLVATSKLVVNNTAWPSAGWDGDAPSGHHRKGTLRFTPAGPCKGSVALTIGGLSEPISFNWDVGT